MLNSYKRLLRDIMVGIRISKPRQIVADETRIHIGQLEKYAAESCEDYRPRVDEHVRLVRSINEADKDFALLLAQSVVPSELFRVVPVDSHPDSLADETIQLMGAAGAIAAKYHAAASDGVIDQHEREYLRAALSRLESEAADFRAALDSGE